MFERRSDGEGQRELWVVRSEIAAPKAAGFYRKLNETLRASRFGEEVWKLCAPHYAEATRGGRPGIDPVIYFKMLMVGFFEDLPSQRAIAARCDDSRALREFLGYDLTEATPEQSSFTVIRQRLPLATIEAVHGVVLRALHAHGLLRGRQLGIDSSVIEANASLRALAHRNTAETYWDYVKALAAEAGLDPEDTKAVRRFDKQRPGRKTSNAEWHNPHDPEAKVGRTKHGASDMIYKPEHVSDLESGAIVRAEVRPGDAGDTEQMSARVAEALGTLAEVRGAAQRPQRGAELAADEGYFALGEIALLQEMKVRTVISDPQAARRRRDLPAAESKVLRRARRAVQSQSGKALLRRRGEHLERGFCHVLDHGGRRRATLRGYEKLTKAYYGAILGHNLSVLMRALHGCGTPKQWVATVVLALCRWLTCLLGAFQLRPAHRHRPHSGQNDFLFAPSFRHASTQMPRFSTGC